MKIFSVLAIVLLFSGCTNVLLRPNNFPYFSGTYYPMMNQGKHPVIFTVNGCYIGKDVSDWTLEPGELTTVRLWGTNAAMTVTFQQIDCAGRVIGAASDSVFVSDARQSRAVVLTDLGVTFCGSLLCRWQ